MQDDFFDDLDLDDEEDDFEATPDWMAFDNDDLDEPDEGDQFDMLRQKSARAGSAFDDMAEEDPFGSNQGSSSFSLAGLTSSQRMILAVLVLLNVVVIGVALVLYLR